MHVLGLLALGFTLFLAMAVHLYLWHRKRNGWGRAFLDNIDKVATWTNHSKTRCLIASQEVDVDMNYVKYELNQNAKTDKIKFEIYNIKDQNGVVQAQDEFMKKFQDFCPTVVVDTLKGDMRNRLLNWCYSKNPPGFVAAVLKSTGHFSEILLSKPTYMFIETLNVWHHEKCIFTSLVEVNMPGVRKQLEYAKECGLLKNTPDTRIIIISGGHGGLVKNKRVTPAGGVSCFSDQDLLEYSFYYQDCDTVGIQPEPDICTYKNPANRKGVLHVDQTVAKPKPDPKQKLNNKGSLSMDPKFNQMSFDVLNVAHYGIYDPKNKQSSILHRSKYTSNVEKLVQYLEKYRPTFIMIGWCFSNSGDLSMALRSRGIFSKLLLEHELRVITKDEKAQLSDEQLEVLSAAAEMDPTGKKPKYKNFHLVGSSGVGKTVLAVAIVKMILAQLCQDLQLREYVRVLVLNVHFGGDGDKTTSILGAKLCDEMKDVINSYPVILSKRTCNMQLCDKSQQLVNYMKSVMEAKDIAPTKYTVLLTDEVTIKSINVNGEQVQSFASMDKFGNNIYCVYAHSPVDVKNSEFTFKVELPVRHDVYTKHLHSRYRNTKKILQFLKFLTREGLARNTHKEGLLKTSTLFDGDDKDAEKLPPTLSASNHHPVLWIDCQWIWKEMETRLTKEMVHSLVPDMDIFDPSSLLPVPVMVLADVGDLKDKITPATGWSYIDWAACAGLEEEIVVVVAPNFLRYESLSRARKQLVIVTGLDYDDDHKVMLNTALNENLLEKICRNDKPSEIQEVW